MEWKQLLRKYGVDTVECAASCWSAVYEQNFQEILKRILKSGECFSLHHLAINGNDLLSAGYDGKRIGEMLNSLLDAVISSPEKNSRETLLRMASSEQKDN